MAAMTAARCRFFPGIVALSLCVLLADQTVRAGEPTAASAKASPGVRWPDDPDDGDAAVAITPEVQAKLLDVVFILFTDTSVTPKTEKEEEKNPKTTGGGVKTPTAPEPATLVLGLVGSALVLMTGYRRRKSVGVPAATN